MQTSQNAPGRIFVDANNYYWSNCNDNTVMMQPFAGGTPVMAYWVAGSGVWQAPLTSAGPLVRLDVPATNGGADGFIAVDATSVYWIAPTNGVFKNAIGGGNEVTLAVGAYHGLAIDATRVCWSTNTSLYATTKDGATTATIASGTLAYALALDVTTVYWSDGTSIFKAPK